MALNCENWRYLISWTRQLLEIECDFVKRNEKKTRDSIEFYWFALMMWIDLLHLDDFDCSRYFDRKWLIWNCANFSSKNPVLEMCSSILFENVRTLFDKILLKNYAISSFILENSPEENNSVFPKIQIAWSL